MLAQHHLLHTAHVRPSPVLHYNRARSSWRLCGRPTVLRSCRHCRRSQLYTLCVATDSSTAACVLPAKLQHIITAFSMVSDPKLKYQQLLHYGKKLPPFPKEEEVDSNKVRGCVSQVWVVPELQEGCVHWRANSDAMITKGLAALLIQGLDGCTPEEVVRIPPDFMDKLGFQQALTPSRNNGFLNMFKLMQAKCLAML